MDFTSPARVCSIARAFSHHNPLFAVVLAMSSYEAGRVVDNGDSATPLPRLRYMPRLDVFVLVSTLLTFFSLIEVLVTTILDNNDQVARAKKFDRYCRVIVPVIFAIASIAILAHPRG
jgi:hypothetical protein